MRLLIAALLLLSPVTHAADITDRMSLIEAIESVRDDGVEITYSSRLVEAWMRVRSTPSETDSLDQLQEVLAPYALKLKQNPGGQWLIVKGEPPRQSVELGPDGNTPVVQPETVSEPLIDEIIIVASRYSLYDQGSTTGQFLTSEEIRLLPHIADDVFRAFHRLPGVAATDFSAPFHLRGGAVDEVKVVLDGLELFEPYHMRTLFSPLSIVDPGIIENVNVLSGGFTADHGNHMSGVVDISSKWETGEPVHELGVSFINSFVRSSGAMGDRGAYHVSARRGYLDLLVDAAAVGDEEFSPRYSDIFAKAGYAISDSVNIDAHLLLASDKLKYSDETEGEEGKSESSLKYAWISLDAEPNDHTHWKTILSTGRVQNRDQGSAENLPANDINRFLDRDVKVNALQSDLSLKVNESQVWMFGLRYRHLQADYDYEVDSVRQSALFNEGLPLVIQRDITSSSDGNELGVYARYRFRPTLRSTWELGLRWDRQTYTETESDSQLSPRLNVLFQINDDMDLRFGWGNYFQPQGIQNLQVEDGVTHYYPAAQARHLVAGFRKRFASSLDLQVDIYQKSYSDLQPRFENALDGFDYAGETDFDRVRIEPSSAESKGVELTLRDYQGDGFDWWLNYTLSKADDLIGGVSVPRSWDQRHAVTGNLIWRRNRWVFSLVGRYHSGWPRTPLLVNPLLDAGGELISINGDLSQLNQTNYDDYFRVDLRLSRTVDLNRGSFQYYLEIFNLFNTENQCCVSNHNVSFGPTITLSPSFDAYLPLFPSFGFVWTFGPGVG